MCHPLVTRRIGASSIVVVGKGGAVIIIVSVVLLTAYAANPNPNDHATYAHELIVFDTTVWQATRNQMVLTRLWQNIVRIRAALGAITPETMRLCRERGRAGARISVGYH